MPSKTTLIVSLLMSATLAAAGWGGWLAGRYSGKQEPQTAQASPPPAPVSVDPGTWSIAQGEEATRRHIREGLKAGSLDPQTGKRILNYHDPMVPGKNFEAPGKSPFMDMMLNRPVYRGGRLV